MLDYGNKYRQQIIQASSNVIDPKVFEAKRQERAKNRAAMRAVRLMRPVKLWDEYNHDDEVVK